MLDLCVRVLVRAPALAGVGGRERLALLLQGHPSHCLLAHGDVLGVDLGRCQLWPDLVFRHVGTPPALAYSPQVNFLVQQAWFCYAIWRAVARLDRPEGALRGAPTRLGGGTDRHNGSPGPPVGGILRRIRPAAPKNRAAGGVTWPYRANICTTNPPRRAAGASGSYMQHRSFGRSRHLLAVRGKGAWFQRQDTGAWRRRDLGDHTRPACRILMHLLQWPALSAWQAPPGRARVNGGPAAAAARRPPHAVAHKAERQVRRAGGAPLPPPR